MKRLFFTFLFAASAGLAAAKDVKTDTLCVTTLPEMHCSGCENKIKGNIRFVKGVKNIITSVPDQTVTIVFDPRKTNYETIAAAFKKIGYAFQPVNKNVENHD